jgi:hypothetical protein
MTSSTRWASLAGLANLDGWTVDLTFSPVDGDAVFEIAERLRWIGTEAKRLSR